jgi:hypothetical protein
LKKKKRYSIFFKYFKSNCENRGLNLEKVINGDQNNKPQEASFSEKSRMLIKNLYRKLTSNFNSWTYHYWLIFFGIIPLIILTIAFLSTVLPKETFAIFFIQNQSNFLSISTYSNHFSHIEISHLVFNLIFYLLSLTVIFIFEENKKRFVICSITFIVVVPILGSYLTQQIWEIVHFVNGQNLGFSAIALAFFGYALYVSNKWLYTTLLTFISSKSSETKIFKGIIQNFSGKEISSHELVQNIGFIILFCLFALMMENTIKFGFSAGQYDIVKGAMSNGIGHFIGFVLGLLSPIIFSIVIEKKEQIFDMVFLLLLLIGIWNYYNQYLTPLLFL